MPSLRHLRAPPHPKESAIEVTKGEILLRKDVVLCHQRLEMWVWIPAKASDSVNFGDGCLEVKGIPNILPEADV